MNDTELAPVLLFVYNRLDHLIITIDALKSNCLADETKLYIISDGARQNDEVNSKKVEDVRAYISQVSGFKDVSLILNSVNKGLAKNIIEAVSELILLHGKVIVLEDDIVTSKYFLRYMNTALNKYQHESKVWHISGWNYPLENFVNAHDSFLWRGMNCWGWATWDDRWVEFSKDPERLINTWNRSEIARFNIGGSKNFFSQVKMNYNKQINTWAIFWYATIFEKNGLCLNPSLTLTRNIGLDGSGTHCKSQNNNDLFNFENKVNSYPEEILEDKYYYKKIFKYLKKSEPNIIKRARDKINRIINR